MLSKDFHLCTLQFLGRDLERSLLPLIQSRKREDHQSRASARKSSIAQARENRIARSLEDMLNDLLLVNQCAMPPTDFNDPTTEWLD